MEKYGMQQLRELMARLRDPQSGCPWDLEQDYRSLVPHTLEEVYELVDAIERGDTPQLRDELGDYLFQAVFYAQVAAERGDFDLDDVTHGIVSKLLHRHPHVFPDGTLQSAREPGESPDSARIHARWESIKREDRARRDQHGLLDDVPLALPALQRAGKLQRRAAGGGFDWPSRDGPLQKLHEELAELGVAADGGDAAACEEELGDLLFSCVNLGRHLGIDPESALRQANAKFERRFRMVEEALATRGLRPADCDLRTLDAEWEAAKARLSAAGDGAGDALVKPTTTV